MNALVDAHLLGWLLLLLAALQLLPVALAAWDGGSLAPLLLSTAITAGVGVSVLGSTRPRGGRASWRLRARDGFVVVGVGWVLVSLFGSLPYFLTDTLGLVDAIFESVAGFTTTGSSVMTGLEGTPRSLLLWRSLTQWIGGMGIVLFTIAILPLLPVGGMQLFKAEVPGPISDKLEPRVAVTARRLWGIYVALTAIEIALLWFAGMPLFDAVCHAFTTLATGGFSTRDASIAAFQAPWVEWIIVFFMLCAGINFLLHYRLLQGRFRAVWRDDELRYFSLVVAGATASVTGALWITQGGGEDALRKAAFQVVSILTTTGYATADFEAWPSVVQLLLLQLMFLGGMAGSTAGGVKSLRVLLGVRALRVAFDRLLHPHAVRGVKYADHAVPEDVLGGIWAFFTAYALLAVLLAAAVAAAGYDPLTALSAALTAVSNVGPGLGAVGPTETFAHFPDLVKLLLCFGMLAGRLEVFTLLILLSPGFWRR